MDREKKEETARPASEGAQVATEAAETAGTSEAECDISSQEDRSVPEAEKPEAGESADSGAAPSEDAAAVDWKDQYARLLADFDNFKKRTARDREDTYRFAEADILKDVLPAIDNLALALQNAGDKAEDPFVKGVQMVYDAILKSFGDHQAEPFDSVGRKLDPERMEAIASLPSDTVAEGRVSNEVKRGWLLKGRLLRAAQVVVSSGKSA